VPHKYLGQAAGIIKKFASIRGESYSSTGCTYEVSFVPGDYQPLLQEIQKVTNGEVQFDVAGGALAVCLFCALLHLRFQNAYTIHRQPRKRKAKEKVNQHAAEKPKEVNK